MKIESIRLKNFKSFKDAELSDLPNFCVIVGANGTGKSTIFQIFGFLRDAMTSNVNAALARLGEAAASRRFVAEMRVDRLKSN